jgi:hypothetical protein
MRILGPLKSAMMATRRLVARDAERRVSITLLWLSKSPWEKLSRATFMPASSICSITCWDSDAGPMVQTILVLFGGKNVKSCLHTTISSPMLL